VEVLNSSYLVGDFVNVTIRTYPTVSQANLSISFLNTTTFDTTTVLDQPLTLTDGRISEVYYSATWPTDLRKALSYYAEANASVSKRTVEDQDYFSFDVFYVNVETNESRYLSGQRVKVTTSTTWAQAGAALTLRVSNSTHLYRTYNTSGIEPDGMAYNTIDTTGWPVEDYEIEASVVSGFDYMRNGTATFKVFIRTFNIYATLDASSYTDFTMPALTITTVPGQTNANLTLTVDGLEGEYYAFTKTGFDSSTYLYGVPLLKQPNGTNIIEVKVVSSAGTNETSAILSYTHSAGMSVIPESFLLETLLIIGSTPIFYHAVRKRRQRQSSEKL
jgi:hypothetical protein